MKKILLVLSFLALFSCLFVWQNKSYLSTSQAQVEPKIPGGTWISWIDATKLTDADLHYIAGHYDIYRDQNGTLSKEQITRLHQLNPNIKILRYNTHSAVCGKKNWEPLIKTHPEWWLRSSEIDQNGENVIVTWIVEGCKVLKPNLKATREFIWNRYQEEFAKDYDGIFADISGPGVWGSNFRPQPPATPIIDPNPQRGGDYTQDEWISDQIARFQFLRQHLGDKLHLWNPIPYNWDTYKNTKYFWQDSQAGGTQFDGFLNKRDLEKERWEKAVNILADAIRTQQIILVKTKNLDESLSERKKIETFSFASYLLALSPKNDRSAYFCHCYDREKELSSLVEDTRPQVKIGKPTQDSVKSGNNYIDGFEIPNHKSHRRNFEYGTVLVNPTGSKDENINLGQTYYDGGAPVTEIDLPGRSAKILTTYSQREINLSQGWNQITWPDISNYTAKTTLEDMDSDCGMETSVAISRKRKDWWENFVKNYGGESFSLQKNQTYFIKVSKGCAWHP